jgi:hypothetical protein
MTRAAGDVIGADGKVRVLSRQCDTCLFRPGNLCHLPAGRFEEVITGNLRAEALMTCHETLPYGQYPRFGPAVCAGYWARYSRAVICGRLARMIGVIRVPPPAHMRRRYGCAWSP